MTKSGYKVVSADMPKESGKATHPARPKMSLVFDQDHGDALHQKLAKTISVATELYIVVGFITQRGVELLETVIKAKPKAVRLIAVGHGGLNALEALAKLRDDYHIPEDNLRIDRGAMAKVYGSSSIYAPMLHSKIYYAERPNGKATAYVGSHNLTEYAISGLNCEAGVRIFGKRECPEFERIRQHIDQIRAKTVKFEPSMIDRYVWLHNKYLETLREGIASYETTPIMVIAAQPPRGQLPQPNDTIYFEVPRDDDDFERFQEVGHRVHVHIVSNASSIHSLTSLSSVRGTILVGQIHLSNETGREGTAGRVVSDTKMDWIIRDIGNPILEKVSGLISTPGRRALQVQVIIDTVGDYAFDYSPPEGYLYKARASERRVLTSEAVGAMKEDGILGASLGRMAEEMMQLHEIERIDRENRRDLRRNEEWRGTKRLKLRDPERELPMWYTRYSHSLEDIGNGSNVGGSQA